MSSGLPAHLQGLQRAVTLDTEPKTYSYYKFLQKVVPFVQKQEATSPYYRLHYVFVHEERRDFLDLTGTIGEVLGTLDFLSTEYGIPKHALFEYVTVYQTGRNALSGKVDPLLAEGYANIAQNNLNKKTSLTQRHQEFDQLEKNRMRAFEESKMGMRLPLNIVDYGVSEFMFGKKTPKASRRRPRRRSATSRRRRNRS